MVSHNEIYHCWHQGIGTKKAATVTINNNMIHDAQLSINCELGAMPTITNNRFEAAPVSPDCPPGTGNQDIGRSADNPGGTYGGKLIYPSSAAN
ncbi:right-handed parallel beta-helix repeat-containing protein [Candidatus Berkelbacteria bacterium]|nr:right-handed parallel beta-helix repeat-containing protein [Candidatus Berkelbacteria bacterium]